MMAAPIFMPAPGIVDALQLRRRLGRDEWAAPKPIGESWGFVRHDGSRTVVVSSFAVDGVAWIHASIAGTHRAAELPSYDELTRLHRAVWGDNGHAYQAFVPVDQHVNLHEYALHLWGRADGQSMLPEFALGGSI